MSGDVLVELAAHLAGAAGRVVSQVIVATVDAVAVGSPLGASDAGADLPIAADGVGIRLALHTAASAISRKPSIGLAAVARQAVAVRPPAVEWKTARMAFPRYVSTSPRVARAADRVSAVSAEMPR